MITILLVDDQPRVRQGLRMRLALEEDIAVVGEAGDAETALDLVDQLRPDVVIMDVELPGMDGIAATEALTGRTPERASDDAGSRSRSSSSSVVMLSLHDDAQTRERARAAGAFAFVAKQRMDGTLLAAIRRAARSVTPDRNGGSHLGTGTRQNPAMA